MPQINIISREIAAAMHMSVEKETWLRVKSSKTGEEPPPDTVATNKSSFSWNSSSSFLNYMG